MALCILHGSFRQHWEQIQETAKIFQEAGIKILAPDLGPIKGTIDGFALLEGQEQLDPRLIELQYLQNLKRLGDDGFSYFVNPSGYLGRSASYELGLAQALNVPCFFMDKVIDHPAYLPDNSVWSPANLASYITEQGLPQFTPNNTLMQKLWEDLIVPGSVVATGGIIEYRNQKTTEVLLVKTHKWKNRFSIVGGKVRRRERLREALLREVKEETGLNGEVGKHLCTFDQIKDSGYYQAGIQHIYVDNVVRVTSKQVQLNEEAQEYLWSPVEEALRDLDIKPNARHTLEIYAGVVNE